MTHCGLIWYLIHTIIGLNVFINVKKLDWLEINILRIHLNEA